MAIWPACAWGLVGAVLVEMRGLWIALQPFQAPKWPWRDGRGRPQVAGYGIAVACRFGMAAGLNAVYAAADQIAGPLGAVTMGIAAPLLIQQLAAQNGPSAPDPPRSRSANRPQHASAGEQS
ncbi:hypothetical protein [Streptomyces sp. CRN 30]|uniref:hypothetical protein n=1 Tax=Streptomyces sp. CRN 30 TaxID=3075613 RepID=UPI002A8309C3|nr:hypothetical protein [Streptomyces sp. CRN 30]